MGSRRRSRLEVARAAFSASVLLVTIVPGNQTREWSAIDVINWIKAWHKIWVEEAIVAEEERSSCTTRNFPKSKHPRRFCGRH
jgi:hypothetical protein